MPEPKTTKPRPFCKMPGGKTKLLPELLARVPTNFGRYYEPFVGGGALFWALVDRIDVASLSDTNAPLIATYSVVRNDVEALVRRLRALERAAERAPREHYYRIREKDVDEKGDVEIAARFLYLNKTCFNGLWRVNRSGKFNVPYGGGSGKILDAELLRACSRALLPSLVALGVASYEIAVADAAKGDLVYFDPPYLPVSATSDFSSYGSSGFGLGDHVRLRDLARELKARGVRVILSNSDCPKVRELYAKGFRVDRVFAPRAINAVGSKRGAVAEVIVT